MASLKQPYFMKKLFITKIVCLFIISVLVVGCASNNRFTSRKYQPGKYVSHQQKPGKVKVIEQPEKEAVYASKEVGLSVEDLKTTTPPTETIEKETSDKVLSKESVGKSVFYQKIKKKLSVLQTKHPLKIEQAKRKKRSDTKASDGSLDPVALVGFILSILGVAADILGILIIIGTAEYVFMLLFLAGLILGIIGLVFGTQGLRRHRKDGGSSADLVFSIIGTVLGGASILLAIIFTFYSLILFIVGL